MTNTQNTATDPKTYADRRADWTTDRLHRHIARQLSSRSDFIADGDGTSRIDASIAGSRMVLADRGDA